MNGVAFGFLVGIALGAVLMLIAMLVYGIYQRWVFERRHPGQRLLQS